MPDLLESMPEELRQRYLSAVTQEAFDRNSAFLGLTETVAGFELRPMTWRDYVTFQTIRSPMLINKTPSTAELIAFLWLLHPDYHPVKGRNRFYRSCRFMVDPPRPWFKWRMEKWYRACAVALMQRAKVLHFCRQYIDSTFGDSPASKHQMQGFQYYSEMVTVCSRFARQFGWSFKEIMDMPIKVSLQFLKEMREQSGRPLFNPSSRIIDEYLCQLNSQPAKTN